MQNMLRAIMSLQQLQRATSCRGGGRGPAGHVVNLYEPNLSIAVDNKYRYVIQHQNGSNTDSIVALADP
jgi:hypothetical protein